MSVCVHVHTPEFVSVCVCMYISVYAVNELTSVCIDWYSVQ